MPQSLAGRTAPACREEVMFRRHVVTLLVGLAAAVATGAPARGQFDNKEQGAVGGQLGKAETHKWEFGVIITVAGGPSTNLHGTAPIPADCPEPQAKIVTEE